MRRTPLVPVALALTAGILLAHYVDALTTAVWLWGMAATAVLTGITLLVNHTRSTAIAAALAVVFVGLTGGLLTTLNDPRHDAHHWTSECPAKTYLDVRLTETPVPRTKSIRAKARAIAVDGHPRRGTVTLYLRPDSIASTLRYGDRLLLHGYPDIEHGWIYATSDHYIITSRDSTSLRARSERLRMRLLHRMQQGPLDRRYAGVAEAMTLGWRADIDPETQASYRDAGIAHLLAVSGLHVGLVAAMAGLALFWVGRERRGRIVRGSIQLTAVWLFAVVTGLAPSTVRAALMFSLFIVSNILGRRTPTLNLLAAAAIIMLVVNPMLLFNTGWQLSFSAVTGIILFHPLPFSRRNRLIKTADACIAATLATSPITILTFHQFYPYFLIANVLIVPLSAFILGFSLLYMALPCSITAWPVEILLRTTETITSWVASLPGAVIEL